MDLIERLEARLAAAESVIERIDLLNELAFELRGKDPKEAWRLAREAYRLSTEGIFADHPYLRGTIDSEVAQARYLAANGQQDEALALWQRAHVITQQRPDLLVTRARIAISMATFYMRKGSYADALRYLQEHLDVGQRLGDRHHEGLALAALGNLHGHIDDITTAVEYSERGLNILHECGDYMHEAGYRCNYAIQLLAAGRFVEALHHAMMALDRSRNHNYEVTEIYALNSVGMALIHLDRYAEAVEYLREALVKDPHLMDEWLVTALHLYYGNALLGVGNMVEAEEELQTALALAQASNSAWMQCDAHEIISTFYKRTGNWQKALEHHELFHAFHKQIKGIEAENRREVLELQYQTDALRREAELQRQKATALEEEINRRRKVEEQLRQAKETAEVATRAKSDFLANMSHEVRTPLNGIVGATEMLLEMSMRSEQRELAQIIQKSSDTLLSIINGILDLSKIEAGKLELERRPFDLRQCVEDALNMVSPAADSKGLDLLCMLDENVPSEIMGDVVRFRQILVNLLGNAVKFTEKGEVVISIQSQTLSPAMIKVLPPTLNGTAKSLSHLLHVKVRDTGIGIGKEQQRRLFQVFSQIDASITRRYGGTGLGLTICKRLVEMMGGKIWVESQEGAGATFQFTLPVESLKTNPKPYQQNHHPLLSGRSVLLLEQNALQRNLLLSQLTRWGMNALAPQNDEELLAWVKQNAAASNSPTLLLVDARIWNRHNALLTTHFDATMLSKRLILLVTTQNIETANQLQSAAFLLRPVRPGLLYNILSELCTNLSSTESTEAGTSASLGATSGKLADRHPLRILLTEDNVVNQKVILRMLERLGYKADVAHNGVDAIAALQRSVYDLVLMDVHMPEMDGITATQLIRSQWEEGTRPMIVALTADALEGDRERLLQEGLDDYLSKPLRAGDLVEKLLKCKPIELEPRLSEPVGGRFEQTGVVAFSVVQ
ncbi:MAG: ATP-binding protein [Caldilineaceae bacterium]